MRGSQDGFGASGQIRFRFVAVAMAPPPIDRESLRRSGNEPKATLESRTLQEVHIYNLWVRSLEYEFSRADTLGGGWYCAGVVMVVGSRDGR